ncbi:MAG: hypothetical protein K1X74_17960 [Pirellulales bacterium]|nr:hypothetical protein [Pirellulales bacterium]
MKRHIFYSVGVLFFGITAALAGYQWRGSRPEVAVAPAPVVATVDPTSTMTEIDARTGDSFWGLHVDGVIPCSTMLVKGGGHLVILAPIDNPQGKCHFHVKDEKRVVLGGRAFLLRVTGDDQIHVQLDTPTRVAAAGA